MRAQIVIRDKPTSLKTSQNLAMWHILHELHYRRRLIQYEAIADHPTRWRLLSGPRLDLHFVEKLYRTASCRFSPRVSFNHGFGQYQ
jgi:hypothetical protein